MPSWKAGKGGEKGGKKGGKGGAAYMGKGGLDPYTPLLANKAVQQMLARDLDWWGQGAPPPPRQQFARQEHYCGRCAGYGHFQSQCPHRHKQCHRCGGHGHLAEACKTKMSDKEEQQDQAKGKGKGKKGKGGKGDGDNAEEPSFADVAKETWKCSHCFLTHTKMAAKSCPSCGKPRRKLEDTGHIIVKTKREKEILKRLQEGGTDAAEDDDLDAQMDHDLAADDSDSEGTNGAMEKRPGETEEDFKRRKKVRGYKLAIANFELMEDWGEAEKMREKLRDIPKPDRLRSTKDKATIMQIIYERRSQEEARLVRVSAQRKDIKARQEKSNTNKAREIKQLREKHEAELRQLEENWEDVEKRLEREAAEMEANAEQVQIETASLIAELEAAADRADDIQADRETEPPEHAEAWKQAARPAKRMKNSMQEAQGIGGPGGTIVRSGKYNTEALRQAMIDRGLDSGEIDIFIEINTRYMNSLSEVESTTGAAEGISS